MFEFLNKRNLISCENLFLIELDLVASCEYVSLIEKRYKLMNYKRYALARKISSDKYRDVFTDTIYDSDIEQGREIVTKSRAILTNYKYISKYEALVILKELNPTYLKDMDECSKVKKLRK